MTPEQKSEAQVQGEYSTAEVTHVLEALRLEGQCYLKNHMLMMMSGTDGAIREWHDNVTRANLDGLKNCAKQMGLALPFPMKLEDRENQLKEKMQGVNVGAIITEGEALAEVKTAGRYLAEFYATSITLATHDAARDAFRRGFENVADNLPRVEQALKGTEMYYPPPIAKNVGIVAEKTVTP